METIGSFKAAELVKHIMEIKKAVADLSPEHRKRLVIEITQSEFEGICNFFNIEDRSPIPIEFAGVEIRIILQA